MTTRLRSDFVAHSCDLLKIHYLCGWNDNRCRNSLHHQLVVICSKFITFVVEMTTVLLEHVQCRKLWFAQNSLPLWLKWQRDNTPNYITQSCDLLKIHYLCGWNDNTKPNPLSLVAVVICSKFITFVVEMTTCAKEVIARTRCDLLKIHYLCGWNDNRNC